MFITYVHTCKMYDHKHIKAGEEEWEYTVVKT